MDLSKTLAELKSRPDYSQHVGMILIHNGTVRSWSRKDRAPVRFIEVTPDRDKIETIRREYLRRDGIYEIIVESREGTLKIGDDLLYIIVAGDIRENVKPVLADLLDRIKAEAVTKKEIAE